MTLDPGLPAALLNAARAVAAVNQRTAATAGTARELQVPGWEGSAASAHLMDMAQLSDKVSSALVAGQTLQQTLESAAGMASQQLEAEAAQRMAESRGGTGH